MSKMKEFDEFSLYFEALGPLVLHLGGSGRPPWRPGTIQSTSRVSLEGSWAALGAPRASPGVLKRGPDGPWVLSGRTLGPPCAFPGGHFWGP